MADVTPCCLTFPVEISFFNQVIILVMTLSIFGSTLGQTVALCDTRIPGSEIPLCHCDEACMVYHDCCYGYAKNKTTISKDAMSQIVKLKEMSSCEHLHGQSYHFYMVRPSIAHSIKARRYLRGCRNPSLSQQFLPIYDAGLGYHFRNTMCRGLYENYNNTIPVLLRWTLETDLDCYNKIPNYTYDAILRHLLVHRACTYTFVPPHDSRPRLCFKHDVELCSTKEKCLSYQSPVVNSAGEVIRNRHCAACLNPHEHYTDLAVTETQHHEETIYTITPLHEKKTNTKVNNCSDTEVCPVNCGDKVSVGLGYFDECIKPVSEARGRLHGLEIQIGRRSYMDPDGRKTRLILSRYVNMTEDMYVKSTVKYTTPTCWNYVHVSIYTIVNIDYETFLKMASMVKDGLAVHTDNINTDIMDSTVPVNQQCVFVKPNTKGIVKAKISPFGDVQLVIFVSIFGGMMFLFSCIVLSQGLIKKLRRASETNEHETNDNVHV